MLTLDVASNHPNNPVFVDLDFLGGNPSTIGNEDQTSISTHFICWEEIALDAISADLTTTTMGLEGCLRPPRHRSPPEPPPPCSGLFRHSRL